MNRAHASDRHPLLADLVALALAVALPVAFIAGNPDGRGPGFAPADLVAVGLGVVLVLLRRRNPVAVLAVALAALVILAGFGAGAPLVAVAVVLLFFAATSVERPAAIALGVVTALTVWLSASVLLDRPVLGPTALAAFAWSAAAVAVADAARGRRAHLEAAEERARRAEDTREQEARRRVAEERLRIARELHDVVAHQMTLINVQASVASELVHDDPDGAASALAIVRDSARSVLAEMGGMLGLMRVSDGRDGLVEPLPTLRELAALVDGFRTAGLDVECSASDGLGELPESIQLTIYRIVQEGLTNASRHGDGRARVSVEAGSSAVVVEISNRIGRRPPAGGTAGFGLAGMRERVAAVGGTIASGPAGDGTFRVAVTLPVVGAEVGA